MAAFADHFSRHAAEYARYRPDYPPALFEYLASAAPGRERAWDCATGNGQAAVGLADHFKMVFATDASLPQIASAVAQPRVRYAVATAELAPLSGESVALVASAQALHWFDRPRFWKEADRVLVPGGIIAVWSYYDFHVTPEIDSVLHRYYKEIVGPYWPPERALVERGYGGLGFPFEPLTPPDFRLEKAWDLPAVLGYMRTWSATQRYQASVGQDPLILVREQLKSAWGPAGLIRTFQWDLDLRVGRKGRSPAGRIRP